MAISIVNDDSVTDMNEALNSVSIAWSTGASSGETHTFRIIGEQSAFVSADPCSYVRSRLQPRL